MGNNARVFELIDEVRQKLQQIELELGRPSSQAGGEINSHLEMELFGLGQEVELIPPMTIGETGLEIVGGEETNDFPDCCAVGNATGYYCSGTLIAPTIVVTARHCIAPTRVFLRGNSIFEPERGETIPVEETFSHPEVDLQVLRLAHPTQVTPRHVAQGDEVIVVEQAMVAGFGRTNFAGTQGYGIKRKALVPVMSMASANPADVNTYGGMANRELVAGHLGLRRDTCKGDSGGPLYIEVAKDVYYLLAATSRGATNALNVCGDGGIYVRVDLCLAWIRQISGVEIEGARL